MAKQTFSTGQVLTAAQMTSLQATAMGGGAASTKTASYVLVAADAGTTVAMNAAGSTTITVNTGLFAAGDTVFIQNIGAGACTITAGTATVSTAGSLILPQYDAGILYFTSASAAIFYDYIQVGAVSPLTTKGDLYTYSTSDTRLGVGANGTFLSADSAEATGLKWATPASGGQTLISTTSLTGSSTSITSIPGTYKDLIFKLVDYKANTSNGRLEFQINGSNTTQNYFNYNTAAGAFYDQQNNSVKPFGNNEVYTTGTETHFTFTIFNYASSTAFKNYWGVGGFYSINSRYDASEVAGSYQATTAISSLTIATNLGTMTGSVLLYGVN